VIFEYQVYKQKRKEIILRKQPKEMKNNRNQGGYNFKIFFFFLRERTINIPYYHCTCIYTHDAKKRKRKYLTSSNQANEENKIMIIT